MWACIGVSEVSFLIWCGPARRVEGVMDLPSPTVITMWYGVCICTGDSTKLDPLKVTQCHWNLNTVRSSRVVVTSCWSPHSTYRISFNCIVSEICGYIGRKTHFCAHLYFTLSRRWPSVPGHVERSSTACRFWAFTSCFPKRAWRLTISLGVAASNVTAKKFCRIAVIDSKIYSRYCNEKLRKLFLPAL